jgi:4-diphosphocytidyl-2-C-methyl-D-erythritol kinase
MNASSQRITLKSPAKLNLYLKILNKRKDGYHNIKTVFEKIDLCDELELRNRPDGDINVLSSHPDCPGGPTNLCHRAARLLKEAFKVPFGVDIIIKKRIPVFSGLGGGSSNAAYTLSGLNKLWKLGLSRKELLKYANRLGSDVAFFLGEGSFALGLGKGERLQYFGGSALWHILVVPDIKLSTAEAYKLIEIRRRRDCRADTKMLTNAGYNVNILIRALRRHDLSLLSKCLFNDFGESLMGVHPGLFKVKNRLEKLGVPGVGLSGKGPSMAMLDRRFVDGDNRGQDILKRGH